MSGNLANENFELLAVKVFFLGFDHIGRHFGYTQKGTVDDRLQRRVCADQPCMRKKFVDSLTVVAVSVRPAASLNFILSLRSFRL